jgi:hypothetical protein
MSMIDIQNDRKKYIDELLQNRRPVAAFAKGFAGTLSGLIILFAAATSMYEANAWLPALIAFLLALSMSVRVVIAAVLVGFVLEFLFGIPKTLQRVTLLLPNQKAESDPTGGGAVPPATAGDEKIAQIPRAALRTSADVIGWASAQASNGAYLVAEDPFRDALQNDPNSNDLRIAIASVRHLRRNYSGASDMIAEAIGRSSDPSTRADLLRRAVLNALYAPSPTGIEQALNWVDVLLKTAGGATSIAYLWKAAALGPKYSWLKAQTGTSPEDLNVVRSATLEAIHRLRGLAPNPLGSTRILLKSIYDPAAKATTRPRTMTSRV